MAQKVSNGLLATQPQGPACGSPAGVGCERECGEDGENGSLPLKSVSGPPLQQFPEQRDPVAFRRDPSGSPAEAMSEVCSRSVCGGESEGAMGAGRQWVGASNTLRHGIRDGNVFEKLETWS